VITVSGNACRQQCWQFRSDAVTVFNQWLTEYWKVTTGTFGQPNTHFEAWAGYSGQPLTKFIDLPNLTFDNPSAPADAIEELILQPYFSQASASTTSRADAEYEYMYIAMKIPSMLLCIS
jgi:hypothetical protein